MSNMLTKLGKFDIGSLVTVQGFPGVWYVLCAPGKNTELPKSWGRGFRYEDYPVGYRWVSPYSPGARAHAVNFKLCAMKELTSVAGNAVEKDTLI